jgi:hypothetical protein
MRWARRGHRPHRNRHNEVGDSKKAPDVADNPPSRLQQPRRIFGQPHQGRCQCSTLREAEAVSFGQGAVANGVRHVMRAARRLAAAQLVVNTSCYPARELQKEATMPVRIFYVQGNKSIGELEREINKWQISLGPKASVTHISTAMTEHEDEGEGWQTRMTVTIWYEL